MSRTLPPDVARIGQLLVHLAGGYLHNTIRQPGVTCAVCAAPVQSGTSLCIPCGAHAAAGIPRADRVASLIYAVEYDSQAYKLVRNYKGAGPGPSQRDLMSSLLALGLRGHAVCARRLAGQPGGDMGWSVVPSTRGRTTLHTLVSTLARDPGQEVQLIPAPGARGGTSATARDLGPASVLVAGPAPYPQHVLLIDDSWVSGGHAQSAAAVLKNAGVQQVSIITVARILSPGWAPNPAFIPAHLSRTFDPSGCPWTGTGCP